MEQRGFLVSAKLHSCFCSTQNWPLPDFCHISHLHMEFVWVVTMPTRDLQMNEMNDFFILQDMIPNTPVHMY